MLTENISVSDTCIGIQDSCLLEINSHKNIISEIVNKNDENLLNLESLEASINKEKDIISGNSDDNYNFDFFDPSIWKVKNWLELANYNIFKEDLSELKPWECWKCILTVKFNDKSDDFNFILWSRLSKVIPTDIWDAVELFIYNNIEEVWYHKNINNHNADWYLWWTNYIILNNNKILLWFPSSEFWWVPREIIKRCLERNWFDIVELPSIFYLQKKEFLIKCQELSINNPKVYL